MSRTLFVKGLPWETTGQDLERLFGACGAVVSAKVLTERDSGRSRGMGFVEMGSDEAAQNAMGKLDGSMVGERWISVTVARPQEERPAREPSRRHPEGVSPGGIERRSGRDRRKGWGFLGDRREGFGGKKPWERKDGPGGENKPWAGKPGGGFKKKFAGKPKFGKFKRPRPE